MWALLWLIPGLLALLLLWILLAPLQIVVNTARDLYQVRMPGLFRLWVEPAGLDLKLRLRIMFFSVKLRRAKRSKKKKDKRGGKIQSLRKMPAYFRAVWGGFRVRRCFLVLDTGDAPTNAQLYPLIGPLQQMGIVLHVNFEDQNRLEMDIQGRIYRIVFRVLQVAFRR